MLNHRSVVRLTALWVALAPVLAAQAPKAGATSAADSLMFRALQWRNIGPARGGRAVAVSGVTSQPRTYYAGFTGGGVWRTDDAGISWRNISDGFLRSGSIGAIAVAESDPNVVYVGTGEHPVRGQSSSYGDGMYRSTDAGKTWTHLGLEKTRQISAVRVHPRDPDVVYVAAQGDRWQGSADRGIYRSRDGGKSWTLLLKGENATSGAADLSLDPTNPRVLYAAFWDHQRTPWKVRSGGSGSGLWKSTDGGDSWTRLTEGLPRLMGKVGVAVSPANPDRVFAIVEAEPNGGLYRSDDAGKSWRLLSGDRLIQTRSWYYMKVTADPLNADVVWVMNAPVLRSIDGGRTFATVPATHGDNHQLWINPADSRLLINANDGGASVSLDGGKSWSRQDNQPTAQFYHVMVDDVYPYRVYGGQQDNSSVIIQSRSDNATIGEDEWEDGPGCESANVGVDRRAPRFVYGGCYQGIIDELDRQTGVRRAVMPYPALNLTEDTDKQRFRFNWTAPIVVSQHDGRVVYHGGNVLFRTTDRGRRWTPISPDLTRNDKATQGPGGGPITNEGAGGEVYNTIVTISESPRDAKVLWVGTDDGLVQVTRDGGATWGNVTPPGVGEGLSNHLDASPHDAGTAYLAFRRDRRGDPAPYAFKTTDFGRTWTAIAKGLRSGEPVRVVRADPEVRGLLYAGTETGSYVSMDDGASWQPFSQNLPVVPVTDLQVRHGDLYASTEGRAFWVLDDLSPVRQMASMAATAGVHLFAPRAAHRGMGGAPAVSVGRNPPPGAMVWYALATAPDSATEVRVEFVDAAGDVVRRFSSRPAAGGGSGAPTSGAAAGGGAGGARLQPKAGLNLMTWDLRREPPTRLPGNVNIWGGPSGGALAPLGHYTVRLTVGREVRTASLELREDPRLESTVAEAAARDSLASVLSARVGEIHDALLRLRDIKTQVSAITQRTKDVPNAKAIGDAGTGITRAVDGLDPKLSTKAANGQDVINYYNGINAQYAFLLGQLEGHDVVTQPVRDRFAELERQWFGLRGEIEQVERVVVPAFNKLLQDAGVGGVIQPAPQAVEKPKVASD